MRLDTHYFEEYARISLADLLGGDYEELFNGDKPDLQDCRGRLGIEVTRAMRENKEEAQSFVKEILGEPVNCNGGIWERGLLLHAVYKKVKLLKENEYLNFEKYGLYVFSAEDIDKEKIEDTLKIIRNMQKNKIKKYSTLYINEVQRLYVCDLEECSYGEILLPLEKQKYFKEQALKAMEDRRSR